MKRKTAKRWTAALAAGLVLLVSASLCACGDKEESGEEPAAFEIALITDESGIDDGSYLQSTWDAIQAFGEENGMTCQYYPSDDEEKAYLRTIRDAKDNGAKLVVLAGSQFETVAYKAQEKYEDLYFVLLDGVPRDEDYNYDTSGNSIGVLFAEEEAGYLAGYAAVCEGYTKMGFMGGNAVPPVKRYGYGFVQGVSAAVQEKHTGGVQIRYAYLGTFDGSDEIESESFNWYEDGTEIIFACGGSIGESVMAAAETAGTSVIGVDADQSGLSETVITSALKNTARAITDILKSYKRNNFAGGAILNYDADNKGIGLEMTNARFTVFDYETYKEIYRGIRSGERSIAKDAENDDVKSLAGDNVEIEVIDE